MATKTVEVEIERLLLDEANPRFGKPLSQDDMLARFAGDTKTLKLATHIAANGVNPLDIPAVAPGPKPGRYVIKEGNRRLAALKLLNNPHLATEDRLVSRYRTIAKGAKKSAVPRKLLCMLFTRPEEANEWVLIKHGGQMEGAGTVEWDGIQRGRFNLRSGRAEQYAAAIGFLDEAVENEWTGEDDANDVNISSLARVLNDKHVQRDLRITVENGQVTLGLANDGPERLAKRLVSDWRKESGLKVEEILPVEQSTPHVPGEYRALYTYLEHRYASVVVLTFEQIEALLGFALPKPARTDRDWWSDIVDTQRHSAAWKVAGRTAAPNLGAGTITFERPV